MFSPRCPLGFSCERSVASPYPSETVSRFSPTSANDSPSLQAGSRGERCSVSLRGSTRRAVDLLEQRQHLCHE